jgi:hypothetical protein
VTTCAWRHPAAIQTVKNIETAPKNAIETYSTQLGLSQP